MPKNKGKGGKNRRRGKNENEGLKRELVFKEDGQEYAQVEGGGYVQWMPVLWIHSISYGRIRIRFMKRIRIRIRVARYRDKST